MSTFAAYGAMGQTCQLPRILAGFETIGIENVTNPVTSSRPPAKPDFIYANDSGGYEEAIDLKTLFPESKLILNVLDICEHCLPNLDLGRLETQLRAADAITAISPYVQSQLMRYFGLESTVIWNPIKDVSPTQRLAGIKHYPQFRAAMIGRLQDPGKRASLGIQSLILAGFNESEVAMVGSEYPGWGTRMGVVSDEVLNDLYNSVDYVVVTSAFEGLGLPIVEALVCGAIPIVCSDLTTFRDLELKREWGCYPVPHSIAHRLRRLQNSSFLRGWDHRCAALLGNRLAAKMGAHSVAHNIVNVYRSLPS